ncbi:hypothetical protein E0L36_06925 [Streptomyces sp. AJS327]|uniref:hypothetical protein n=1 Tax=Streptomyces sp. AJS327 TaxID=2545265 RepID=UPI0015DE327C|nr:hypothetical protein [Streptomyces sp. AJS327]MBA0050640.1 hypothetical protein [Streptomyces sp. AJS327]
MAVMAVAAVTGSGVAQGAPETTAAPEPLVTYNNNIENMVPESCSGDRFDRLIEYVKSQPRSPGILTVQQISDSEQLKALTKRLSDELPGTFKGRIAVADPGSMGYTSKCGKLKNQQTNAVIYRTQRLTLEDATTWRSDAPQGAKGKCRNLEPTETSQDRVHNVAVRLRDTVEKKDVTVASIHWPTAKWNGPDCASENIREANRAVDNLGGDVRIVAGDANIDVGVGNWWSKARGYGFADPIAEKCGGRDCPSRHDTLNKRRVDVLLAKKANGFREVATVTEKMAGGSYSNHRAVTAYVIP